MIRSAANKYAFLEEVRIKVGYSGKKHAFEAHYQNIPYSSLCLLYGRRALGTHCRGDQDMPRENLLLPIQTYRRAYNISTNASR